MSEIDKACEALFTGRINVPTAAALCDVTVENMKTVFVEYACRRSRDDWELDIVLCWPYA